MAEQTTLDGHVTANPDQPAVRSFLGSIAARLRHGRSPLTGARTGEIGARKANAEARPETSTPRRSGTRSSMDAGITGGMTLFGPKGGK